MYRAVFLRLVSLGVLLFTLWSQITCEGDKTDTKCELCYYNYKNYQVINPLECMWTMFKDATSSQKGQRRHQVVKQVQPWFQKTKVVKCKLQQNIKNSFKNCSWAQVAHILCTSMCFSVPTLFKWGLYQQLQTKHRENKYISAVRRW